MKFTLSSIFLIGAAVCFAGFAYLLWLRYVPVSVSFTSLPIPPASSSLSTGSLSGILSLPDLSIRLPVATAQVTANHWPVSPTGLIHIAATPQPGDSGNSIIYGHNWPNLLGKLVHAKVGQQIYISSSSGLTKTFRISAISTVTPQDPSLLQPSSDARLTLYTCTGFLDSRRLVVTAVASF